MVILCCVSTALKDCSQLWPSTQTCQIHVCSFFWYHRTDCEDLAFETTDWQCKCIFLAVKVGIAYIQWIPCVIYKGFISTWGNSVCIHTVLFYLASSSLSARDPGWKQFIYPSIAFLHHEGRIMFPLKCLPENSSIVETAKCVESFIATWLRLSINHNELHISASLWNLHSSQAAGGCAYQCNCSGSLTAVIVTAYWLFFHVQVGMNIGGLKPSVSLKTFQLRSHISLES